MKIRLNFCVLSQRNCITLLTAQPVNPVKKQRWVTRHWTKEMVLDWVGFTSHNRSTSVLDYCFIVLFSPLFRTNNDSMSIVWGTVNGTVSVHLLCMPELLKYNTLYFFSTCFFSGIGKYLLFTAEKLGVFLYTFEWHWFS